MALIFDERNDMSEPSITSNLSWSEAIPHGLQHMIAMIVGCITVPIIVSTAAQLNPSDSIVMMQSSILAAGICILIQTHNLKGMIGSGLPFVIGSGFAFISTMTVIASTMGVSYIFGASLVGACVGILFGFTYKWVKVIFAPVVKAAVVMTIGISLYKVAVGYMAGGAGSAMFGTPLAWGIAIFTLVITIVLGNWAKGVFKTASTLFGIIIGYGVAALVGMVDFSRIAAQPFFNLVTPFHFGIDFSLSAILPLCIVFIVSSIEAVGQMEALCIGTFDRSSKEREVVGGLVGINIGCLFGAVFGGVPSASAGQNVGIVVNNRVIDKKVFYIAGASVIIIGLFPKLAALFLTIPLPVLGGATVAVFGSIAMTGLKMIVADGIDQRNLSILGLALALAIGLSYFHDAFSSFPSWFANVVGNDVVIATVVAIVLNLVLPGRKNHEEKGAVPVVNLAAASKVINPDN